MGHNDDPALDRANPFTTAPAPSAGTIYAGDPHPSARRRRSRRQSPRILPLPPGCASATADCRACPATDATGLPALWWVLGWAPPLPATPVILGRQERDAIKDALEKEMNHYLIFLANAPISAGRFDDLPLEVRGEECRTPGHRLRTR